MNGDYTVNGDVKRALRIKGITIQELASATLYPVFTLTRWLFTPLSPNRKIIVMRGIAAIENRRKEQTT